MLTEEHHGHRHHFLEHIDNLACSLKANLALLQSATKLLPEQPSTVNFRKDVARAVSKLSKACSDFEEDLEKVTVRDIDNGRMAFFDEHTNNLGCEIVWHKELPTIVTVAPNSEAERCGIRPSDEILSINGIPTTGKERKELMTLLRSRPLELGLGRRDHGLHRAPTRAAPACLRGVLACLEASRGGAPTAAGVPAPLAFGELPHINLQASPTVDFDQSYLDQQPSMFRIISELEDAKNSGNVVMTLWPLWASDKEASTFQSVVSNADISHHVHSINDQRYGDENRDDSWWCVLSPSSPKRLMWDVLSLVVLAVDITTLPLVFFGFDQNPVHDDIRMFSTIFWTVDIATTFLKGYSDSGVVVLQMAKIGKKYVRTWFFFDLSVVSIDWTLFFFNAYFADAITVGRVGKLGKLVRVIRLLRILRLLRLVKVMFLLGEIGDFVKSEMTTSVMTIARLLFFLLIVIHFVACGWYAVGTAAFNHSKGSWLDELHVEGLEDDMVYCYAAAFHWSMAQFTPAPINYHPHNRLERFYAIIVLFMGFAFFSAFLANVSSVMNHAMSIARERARQRELTRQYISENKVELGLANQVIAFVRRHRDRASTVLESDVKIFKVLPDTLLHELRRQVYSPILSAYSLFSSLKLKHKGTMAEVCSHAMTSRKVLKDCEVFHFGMKADTVYFVIRGTLEYVSGESVSLSLLANPPEKVAKGDWLCEPVLFMRWNICGQCTAQECADLAMLESKRFRTIVARHPKALTNVRAYARRWFEKATSICAREGKELKDFDDRLHVDLEWSSVGEQTPATPLSVRTNGGLMSKVREVITSSSSIPISWPSTSISGGSRR